jgi:hypothetical protein
MLTATCCESDQRTADTTPIDLPPPAKSALINELKVYRLWRRTSVFAQHIRGWGGRGLARAYGGLMSRRKRR